MGTVYNDERRTPRPTERRRTFSPAPHYASPKRCVVRGEIMRSAFFQINNLHRTHRATPNRRKIGLPACVRARGGGYCRARPTSRNRPVRKACFVLLSFTQCPA